MEAPRHGPEYPPAALQALRQPIEEGAVTLVRASGTVRYPARVTLIAAMNPCPCGYAGDPSRPCTCSEGTVSRYLSRIGGPLYDRMDMSVRVDRIDPALLLSDAAPTLRTIDAREAVSAARAFAHARPALSARRTLAPGTREFVEGAARRMHLSGRAITRLLGVARTIADLDAADFVTEDHAAEALGYRAWEAAR